MRTVTDLVRRSTFGEVAIRDDAISKIGVVIGAGVDDPDADAVALDAALPDRLHLEEGNAFVQERVDRFRWACDESRRLELASQPGLTTFGNVEHDHPGATMRLPDHGVVISQNRLRDAGLERHLLGTNGILERQHRQADGPGRLDDEARARPGGNASVGRGKHVNRILTWLSRASWLADGG